MGSDPKKIIMLNLFKELFASSDHDHKEGRRMNDQKAEMLINKKIDLSALSEKMTFNFGKSESNDKLLTPEIIKTFARLAMELREKATDYDTILSDDCSGRIVSLFLKNLIDREKIKQNKPLTKIYFLPGQHISLRVDEEKKSFIEQRKDGIKKALLSTEYIHSGTTIRKFVDLLEDAGIDFDIATLSIDADPERYDPRISSRLFYGEKGGMGLIFYKLNNCIGVKKIPDSKDAYNPSKLIRDENVDTDKLRNIRQDIKTLAENFEPLMEN